MIKCPFKNPQFVKSATQSSEYPTMRSASGKPLPEIAVVGRSNVGKSTLLNHLFGKPLVKTSATPGKTQLINFFTVDDALAFVDLPGYGYAKAPQQMRKEWATMIDEYLHHRKTLQLLLLLLDIRRTPGEEEKALIDWAVHHQKKLIIVLTKADKVSRHTRIQEERRILGALNMPEAPNVHYSATKNLGRDMLIRMILEKMETEHG